MLILFRKKSRIILTEHTPIVATSSFCARVATWARVNLVKKCSYVPATVLRSTLFYNANAGNKLTGIFMSKQVMWKKTRDPRLSNPLVA